MQQELATSRKAANRSAFSFGAGYGWLAGLIPLILPLFHYSDPQNTSLGASFFYGNLAACILFGLLGYLWPNTPRKPLLAIASVLAVVSGLSMCLPVSQEFQLFWIIRFVQGITVVTWVTVNPIYISDLLPKDQAEAANGVQQPGINIGLLVAAGAVAAVLAVLKAQLFVILGGMTMALGVGLLVQLLKSPSAASNSTGRVSLGSLQRSDWLRIFLGFLFGVGQQVVANNGLQTNLGLVFQQNHLSAAAFVLAVFAVNVGASSLASFIWQHLSPLGRRVLFVAASLIAAVLLLVILTTSSPAVLVAATLGFYAAYQFGPGVACAALIQTVQNERTRFLGGAAGSLGANLTALISVLVFLGGWHNAPVFFGASVVVATLVVTLSGLWLERLLPAEQIEY